MRTFCMIFYDEESQSNMPIYEYACTNCGARVEAIQKLSDEPLTECPECGAHGLVREISAPSFTFKGSGWYINDYAKSGASAKESKKDSAKDSAGSDSSATASGGEKSAGAAPVENAA